MKKIPLQTEQNDEINIPEAPLNMYDMEKYVSKPMLRIQLPNYFHKIKSINQDKKRTYYSE